MRILLFYEQKNKISYGKINYIIKIALEENRLVKEKNIATKRIKKLSLNEKDIIIKFFLFR